MTPAAPRERWSVRLGLFASVPVEVHASFFLLFVWTALQGAWSAGLAGLFFTAPRLLADPGFLAHLSLPLLWAARDIARDCGLLLLVFGCILVHEFSHTAQAQRLGIPVRRIVLLPFGGLAELTRPPERPRDELRVALAGPAANIGLTLVCGGLAGLWLGLSPEAPRQALRQAFDGPLSPLLEVLLTLAFANAALTLFNILPAFPLDGGRILRSLLALVLPRLTATRVVAGLSLLCGLGLTAAAVAAGRSFGLPTALGLLFMAAVVVLGGSYERGQEESRQVLERISIGQAVRQPTWTLTPTDELSPNLLGAFFLRPALPVVVDQRLVGLVAREDLNAALKQPPGGRVAHIMRTRFPYLRAEETLWQAQQLFASAGVSILPVLEGDQLRGMLTAADIRAAHQTPPSGALAEAPIYIAGGNPTL